MEAVERETATSEILRVIAESRTNVQPTFETIIRNAVRLCNGAFGVLFRHDGKIVHVAAHQNLSRQAQDMYAAAFPQPPSKDNPGTSCLLDGKVQNINDIETGPFAAQVKERARAIGYQALLAVPMIRDGKPIGAINVGKRDVGRFSASQVALLKTFADQAVIAIENARLFNELKSSNSSLSEALDQQTATSEILRVISSSPTEVQPVFDTIVRNAVQLGNAAGGFLISYDGTVMRLAAQYNINPQEDSVYRPAFPRPAVRDTMTGRSIIDCAVINIPDILASDFGEGTKERARQAEYRSALIVPMLRDGVPIGTLNIQRRAVGAFPDSYIALLKTFSDQAVIAIENVRLFNETKEALERQTATAEILSSISSSVAEAQPVFDAIVGSLCRLFGTRYAVLALLDGDRLELKALAGDELFIPRVRAAYPYLVTDEGMIATKAMRQMEVVQLAPIVGNPGAPAKSAELARLNQYDSIIAAPLVLEGGAIGYIVTVRAEPAAFDEKQVQLIRSFADQAVIAIQNARLFKETNEALEHQIATSGILGAISSSPTDTAPVFEAIARSGLKLFSGASVTVLIKVGNVVDIGAMTHIDAARAKRNRSNYPVPLSREYLTGMAILDGVLTDVADVDNPTRGIPAASVALVKKNGYKAITVAPMMSAGAGIGAIAVGRDAAGPLSEKQIALLRIFADQAVIAIQNTQLFREIQQKSAQLEVVNRQLEVANKHKSDFLANMSHELRTPLNAIIGFSEVMMEKLFGELNEKQLEYQKDIHASGKHLLSLINDILDLSKIEAGRMELELSSFHLPTAVSNAVTLIRERAQRHGISLGVEVDSRLGEFQADERKVKQILLNLLSNAVKFTPDGGRVDVSAKLDTDKVEIAVKDTGVGIASEDQASLFEEFKQLGKDSSRKAEGTGLGLALTKRLVELHGGQISVDSAVGQGSTFRVMLPLR